MPTPTQSEVFRIALGAMTDGVQRNPNEIKAAVRLSLQMIPDEEGEVTSSDVRVWDSRISWVIQYLQRAGLLTRISRGTYRITELGHSVYSDGTDGAEMQRLLNSLIAKNNPWKIRSCSGLTEC